MPKIPTLEQVEEAYNSGKVDLSVLNLTRRLKGLKPVEPMGEEDALVELDDKLYETTCRSGDR